MRARFEGINRQSLFAVYGSCVSHQRIVQGRYMIDHRLLGRVAKMAGIVGEGTFLGVEPCISKRPVYGSHLFKGWPQVSKG